MYQSHRGGGGGSQYGRGDQPQRQQWGNDRGGGGGGGGGFAKRQKTYEPYKSEIDVITNFFPVSLRIKEPPPEGSNFGFYMYSIAIEKDRGAGSDKKTNKDEELSLPPPLLRAILEQLKKNLWEDTPRKIFATDGSQFGVSPHPLWNHPPKKETGPGGEPITGKTDPNADPNADPNTEPNAITERFGVNLSADVAALDSDVIDPCRQLLRHRRKPSSFYVHCTHFKFIAFDEIQKVLDPFVRQSGPRKGPDTVDCVHYVIRSVMMSTMLAPGRNPQMFYLRPKDHYQAPDMDRLLSKTMKAYYDSGTQKCDRTYVPLIGIRQSAKYLNDKMLLCVDTGTTFFNREETVARPPQRSGPFPVLRGPFDGRWFEIAGVKVKSAETFPGQEPRTVFEPRVRESIENALKDITFHVKYTIRKGRDGKSISKERKLRNLAMILPKDESEKRIIWAANDLRLHSFKYKDAAVTVNDYFWERYGIRLSHPDMPLINTRVGYFPVEFLFQALGKTKNANSDTQRDDVLQFNDMFAKKNRIQHIKTVKSQVETLPSACSSMLDTLQEFNLMLETEPMELKAKVLPPPTISFANSHVNDFRNGSWNLKGKVFHTPALMNSFAVVDLTGEAHITEKVMMELFKKMKSHGIDLPPIIDPFEAIRQQYVTVGIDKHSRDRVLEDPRPVQAAIQEAVVKARHFFLFHPRNRFDMNGLAHGFLTMTSLSFESLGGSTERCLAYPIIEKPEKLGVIFQRDPDDPRWPSHNITLKNRTSVKGRLRYQVDNGSVYELDPIDLLWKPNPQAHELRRTQGQIFEYYNGGNAVLIPARECETVEWIHCVDPEQVECPAIIFVLLPQRHTKIYGTVKFLTNFHHGVQSQCLVQKKYEKGNLESYLSNVALKLNAKLANNFSDARAWVSDTESLASLRQAPTLIIGIGISHSLGRKEASAKTVVAATACLDNFASQNNFGGLMQMGHVVKIIPKTDVIPKGIIANLVMSLVFQYTRRDLPKPTRVLFYRDGVGESNFDKLKSEEFEGIKMAFDQLNSIFMDGQPMNPAVTFLVAQMDHGIRIVPKSTYDNVPFGTCVDHSIVSVDDSHNFLLIPQHGLKGTSRAVYYRVLVDENRFTTDELQKLTFLMSFHYGTATKVVRLVPVVLYSKRLAEQVHSYYYHLEEYLIDPGFGDDKFWVRKDTDHNENFPIPVTQNGILPKFGPFSPFEPSGIVIEDAISHISYCLRSPFRPHLAA